MNKIKSLVGLALCALALSTQAQTNSGTFFQSVTGYFTSFNTNLDSTFGAEKGSLWTGADSLQGADVPLANSIGLSYNLYKLVSAETVIRNSGIAGTLLSWQVGVGLNIVVHDTKLTAYADGGYAFGIKNERIYGELGLRVQKALTEHTFAGVGIGAQLPGNRQIFTAFAGFTF